jgi:hypothetical protein
MFKEHNVVYLKSLSQNLPGCSEKAVRIPVKKQPGFELKLETGTPL